LIIAIFLLFLLNNGLMIQLNLKKMAAARNIERLYTYLVGIGLTPKMASYWAAGNPKRIDLDILERVCLAMRCEPYDILEWIPEQGVIVDNHPLKKMLPKPEPVNLKNLLQTLPKDELDKLLAEIMERTKK
jgi:DNA-binding Xre family transcriptional regulator